jgi:hypothetical protein
MTATVQTDPRRVTATDHVHVLDRARDGEAPERAFESIHGPAYEPDVRSRS